MSITSLFGAESTYTESPRATLLHDYADIRTHTRTLAAPLSAEDQCVQSMPDTSPTKWHLAHTTWFFETMLLRAYLPDYQPFDERYFYLFNSYYEALGPRHPRPRRGLLTRPSLYDIHAYRHQVDKAMAHLIHECGDDRWSQVRRLITLGLHHEQQHQELLLTDILHAFSCNPLWPAYQPIQRIEAISRLAAAIPEATELKWLDMPGSPVSIGHTAQTEKEFAFDNETPRHEMLLHPYKLADRLVTCGEYAQFIADGAYRKPGPWLSDGWATVQAQGWCAPAYWVAPADGSASATDWQVFGLHGLEPMDPLAPVSQLSFYEAAAYAEWAGARLPTEFEWEAAVGHPDVMQMMGHVWQWTRSSYDPYPGFKRVDGALGEYNGKFMVGQLVLRGSSCVTPAGHARASYRNFFPPSARWQFSGLRLARDS